jgi:tripartite-type tricarboxylate transporter receptor subunit TctC
MALGRGCTLAAALTVLALTQTPARAQGAAEFYASHPITLISSFAAGGFNDLASRLVARHFGRFVPGGPNVIVKNVPGAGGVISANAIYQTAPRDGTLIGQLDRGIPQTGFRGAPNVKFDVLGFTWLGSLSTYANEACILWVRADHPAKTVADLQKPGVRTRLGTVPGATNHLLSKVSKKALGLNVDVVTGYPGAGPIWIGLLNGELDGQIIGTSSVESSHPQLLRDGGIRALVQFGRETRMAGYENVPTGLEIARNDDERACPIRGAAFRDISALRGAAEHPGRSREDSGHCFPRHDRRSRLCAGRSAHEDRDQPDRGRAAAGAAEEIRDDVESRDERYNQIIDGDQ